MLFVNGVPRLDRCNVWQSQVQGRALIGVSRVDSLRQFQPVFGDQ
jgi:hypothetical protein